MNQNKATPYKIENKKPETQYEIQENGDIKITQVVTTISFWTYRESLSLLRQNEEALENTKYNYSDKFIEKMKEQEKEIASEIDIMRPIIEKSEELTKIEYEKQRQEGLLKNLRLSLEADEEKSLGWFQNIWLRTKDEIKESIISELNKEEQSKLLKIMQKMKRKKIN